MKGVASITNNKSINNDHQYNINCITFVSASKTNDNLFLCIIKLIAIRLLFCIDFALSAIAIIRYIL